MRIIFFGTPQFAVPSLERLVLDTNFEVLAVVTQPDKRRGRGNELIPSPVKSVALQHQIPVWQPKSVKKNKETLERLRMTQADAFVVVAYGQILSQPILEMPRLGCINAHGSILPKYRGAAPIQWSLYYGEQETGITTMLMDAGMDTGAMLRQRLVQVGLLENALQLAEHLAIVSADLLVETLLGLEAQTIQPIPQDESQATYAPLIQKDNYLLDWCRAAIDLHHQIRGFYPNCVTGFRGESLKIIATVPLGSAYWSLLPDEFNSLTENWGLLAQSFLLDETAPGTIIGILKGFGFVVQTGEGLLLVQEVQLAGKRLQSGWDFANGTRLKVGEVLQAV